MFIDFPNHDFQFVVPHTADSSELSTWLEDNDVSTPTGLSIEHFISNYGSGVTYFTIRCKTIYVAGRSSASDLTIIDLYAEESKSVIALTDIMYSILKEVGYYRKGKKDIVINHILKYFKDNISDALDNNPTELLKALNYEEILEVRFHNANDNDSEVLRIYNFYMSLIALTIKVYCHFNSIPPKKLNSPYPVMHTLSHLRLNDSLSVQIRHCGANKILRVGYDTKNLTEILRRYLRPDRNTDLQMVEDIKTDIIEISRLEKTDV